LQERAGGHPHRLRAGEALTLVPVAAILVASIRLHFLDLTLNAQTRGPTVFPCDVEVRRARSSAGSSSAPLHFHHPGAPVIFKLLRRHRRRGQTRHSRRFKALFEDELSLQFRRLSGSLYRSPAGPIGSGHGNLGDGAALG
jgi:hypothetical protein